MGQLLGKLSVQYLLKNQLVKMMYTLLSMGLINIFRKNNSSEITPFTMDEKIFFVKVFLQTKDILPRDFGDEDGDDLTSLVGTPQYTLVMYLDFLYTFTMNDYIRRKHTKYAAKSGLDLHDFSLNTESLLKLAVYYTNTRKLPSTVRETIQESWQNSVDCSDKGSFDTFKGASYWWEENIVEPLQIFDSVEKKIQENITDDTYKDKVTYQLSFNQSLTDAYLKIRGIE